MNTVKPASVRIAQDDAKPQAPAIATVIFNIIVPLCFAFFAWRHAAAFVSTLRISNLIILTKAALDLQFYVRKSTAPFISTSAYAWLIALGGTIAPLMLRPTTDESDYWVATVMQVIGTAMQVYVISTLDRGVGSTVARRGITRDGLYRFVRHPLYLAFMVSQYGYVLNQASCYNGCVLVLVISLQVLRLNEEESLLLDDREFQEYVEQTPWRIVPMVF